METLSQFFNMLGVKPAIYGTLTVEVKSSEVVKPMNMIGVNMCVYNALQVADASSQGLQSKLRARIYN
jgi:hypothetical protein